MKTWRLSIVAAIAGFAAAPTLAQNTGPLRPITTEWECDNGRAVLFNFHPRRAREEAWVTYIGNRVEVRLSGARYASADGKVTWQIKGDDATLEFAGLLEQPLSCKKKSKSAASKK